jgi:hypothetical protein
MTTTEKIEQIIKLCDEVDDELNNDLCLPIETGEDGEPLDVLSFWGIAMMLETYLNARDK